MPVVKNPAVDKLIEKLKTDISANVYAGWPDNKETYSKLCAAIDELCRHGVTVYMLAEMAVALAGEKKK
jgi:hypothetical protein